MTQRLPGVLLTVARMEKALTSKINIVKKTTRRCNQENLDKYCEAMAAMIKARIELRRAVEVIQSIRRNSKKQEV